MPRLYQYGRLSDGLSGSVSKTYSVNLICPVYISMADCQTVWADLSARLTLLIWYAPSISVWQTVKWSERICQRDLRCVFDTPLLYQYGRLSNCLSGFVSETYSVNLICPVYISMADCQMIWADLSARLTLCIWYAPSISVWQNVKWSEQSCQRDLRCVFDTPLLYRYSRLSNCLSGSVSKTYSVYLICTVYISVADCQMVWAELSLRPTLCIGCVASVSVWQNVILSKSVPETSFVYLVCNVYLSVAECQIEHISPRDFLCILGM